MEHVSTTFSDFEPLRVAVTKLSVAEGISRQSAASKIASLTLFGKLAATGIKRADPMLDEKPCEERQPIPSNDWADFLPSDYAAGIIRIRAGHQLRALSLWHDIQIAAVAPTQIEKRSRAATANALEKATAHVIELRRAGAKKPGGNKGGLRDYLIARFGINAREVEKVVSEARSKAPNSDWDASGRRSKAPL